MTRSSLLIPLPPFHQHHELLMQQGKNNPYSSSSSVVCGVGGCLLVSALCLWYISSSTSSRFLQYRRLVRSTILSFRAIQTVSDAAVPNGRACMMCSSIPILHHAVYALSGFANLSAILSTISAEDNSIGFSSYLPLPETIGSSERKYNARHKSITNSITNGCCC